jgi:O-antigen/teichoic acid export membrane protein
MEQDKTLAPGNGAPSILRNVLETYSAQSFRILGALLFNIWLTRLMMPADRGYYGVGLALAMMATQFGQFGLNTANTYFAAKEPELRRALLGTSTAAAVVLAPAIILIVLAVHWIAPGSIVMPNNCLAVSLVFIPFALSYIFFQGLLLGTYQIRQYNLLEVLNRYIPLAALSGLVLIKSVTPTTVLMCVVVGQAVACLWAWKDLYSQSKGMTVSMPLVGRLLRYGVRVHLATVFSFALFRISLLMVAHMRSAAEAGFFSLATSLAEYMSLPAQFAGLVLLPHLCALKDTKKKFQLMMHWLLGIAALTAPLFLLGGFVGFPIIRLLFGEKYVPAFRGFVWLLPGIYFLGLAVVTIQFITAIGYRLSVPGVWLAVLVVNLAGNLYFIPKYGYVGASALSSACYAIAFFLIFLVAYWNRNSEDISSNSAVVTADYEALQA